MALTPEQQQEIRGLSVELFLHSTKPKDPNLITPQQKRLAKLLATFVQAGNERKILPLIGPLPLSQLLTVTLPGSELGSYLQILQTLEPTQETLPLCKVVSSFANIIVLLGKKASGKGTASGILQDKYGVCGMPTSDWLRAIAAARDYSRPFDPLTLRDLADELRSSFGGSILVELTLREYYLKGQRNVAFDGLRSAQEMSELINSPNVLLIWVDAPDQRRLERVKARNRAGDPTTLAELLAVDGKSFPEAETLRKMCPYHIDNSEDDLDSLEIAIAALMSQKGVSPVTQIIGQPIP